MIEEFVQWFHSYVSYYFSDIVLFLLIGFVFIRCRSIGYAYSAVVVLALIFISYVGGYAMPQRDIAIVIFLGTVAGGWRYLLQSYSFIGSPFRIVRSYFSQRRFRKVYQEEYVREEARQRAKGSKSAKSHQRERGNYSNRDTDSQKRDTHEEQQRRQEERKERFKRSRASDSPGTKAPPQSRSSLEILGLSAGYTQEMLKERYMKLRSQYHPDKFNNMSDAVKKEMKAEFIAVKQAYELLKQ